MRKLLLVMILAYTSSSIAWCQNGTKLIGYDAVTSGRGGTATGIFDNPSLMMNNPAGLAFLPSSQGDLSISLMAPKVYFKNSLNDANGEDNYFPLGSISYAKRPEGNWTYGFGVFTQGGMGADFTLNHELYRDEHGEMVPQPYHSKFAVMQGGGSVAYKIKDWLSAGITANIIYGQVEFGMPMAMPPSILKGIIDPQTAMTFGDLFGSPSQYGGLGYSELVASANMESLEAFGLNGKIGLAFKPNEKVSLGINYTLPVDLKYKDGIASMDMTYQMNHAFQRVVNMILLQNPDTSPQDAQQMALGMFSQMGIDFSKGAVDQYDAKAKFGLPQSLSAGASLKASKKLIIALDAEWINWKKAFDQMDIDLSNGKNENINTMIGAEGSLSMAFPMYWENSIVIRSGVEYNAGRKLTMRGGYAYGSNPVPAKTIFPVFPAIVEHHLTAGFTAKISKAFHLNGAYEYAFRNDKTASEQSLVANEYNNSSSGLENHIFHISLSWLVK